MFDIITVGGFYSRKGLRRVLLFTIVELLTLTAWFYLLSVNAVIAFVELFVGLLVEHYLAGQLEHVQNEPARNPSPSGTA